MESSWMPKKAVRKKERPKGGVSSFDATTLPHFTSIMNDRLEVTSLRKQKGPRPKQDEDPKSRYTTYSVLRRMPFILPFCNGKVPARSTDSVFDLQLKSDFPSIRYSHPASTVPDSLCLLLMCTLFLIVFYVVNLVIL